MNDVKRERLEALMLKEISLIIQKEVKNDRIGFVTLTAVRVTNDLSQAKVYVQFLGQQNRAEAGLKALNSSKGFIRSKLAQKLTNRICPELIFLNDEALAQGNKIESILRKINTTDK